MRDHEKPAIEMQQVSKAYGATVALENVTFSIQPGEVQALLGENGAGKSTLVKILTGVVRPDTGALFLNGNRYTPANVLEARAAGVSTAFQELSLVPNLTVAENFFLPRMLKDASRLTSLKIMTQRAAEILARFGLETVNPARIVSDLPLADRQRIEIARAMERKPKVLILDEPTAALADVEWLFRLVRDLQAKDTAILYISHRLAEIRALAQRATILRSGSSVATVGLSEASDSDIFEMMVGHGVGERKPTRISDSANKPKPVLTVNDLQGSNVDSVSLVLGEGEIVGVAGLDGQGQREMFRILAGHTKPSGGQIILGDRPMRFTNPRSALRSPGGIAFVPEERKTEGIFPSLTSTNNITISMLRKLARFGLVTRRREATFARKPAEAVELNLRYMSFKIGNLSGGNQQKAIIARALLTGAKILLLFDPTRGVDVGTKQTIYNAIRKHAEGGGSVLVYSSELPELIELCDRCLVMYGSEISAELTRDEMDERKMVAIMTGNIAAEARSAETL